MRDYWVSSQVKNRLFHRLMDELGVNSPLEMSYPISSVVLDAEDLSQADLTSEEHLREIYQQERSDLLILTNEFKVQS
jgi:hypothetical protein